MKTNKMSEKNIIKEVKKGVFGGRTSGIETVDRTMDRQIAAKVRKYFEK